MYKKDEITSIIKKVYSKESIRYILFTIITTGVNIAIYQILVMQKCNYMIANLIAITFAKVLVFITNKYAVFRTKSPKKEDEVKEITLFVVFRIITGVVDFIGLFVLVKITGEKVVSKYANVLIVAILNYLFSKYVVFRKKTVNNMEQF